MSELEDRLAIQDVMTRYAAGVDDRDFEQYRGCFADDVEIVGKVLARGDEVEAHESSPNACVLGWPAL